MGKKVYIIDDDQDIVAATRIILEANGYEVNAAYTIEEGEDLTNKDLPDIIILDVMFPGNQSAGFEFCRRLRANKITQKIPIIIFTAVNRKFSFKHDINEEWLPADEFLEKPVDPSDLLRKMKFYLK